MGLSTYVISRIFYKFQNLSQFRVEEIKNLPSDGYQAMLNTGPLGGEWVAFFCIVSYSMAKQNI
jgi:hypothetical protein